MEFIASLIYFSKRSESKIRSVSATARIAKRKGMSVTEIERWLGQNLNYDPAE